MYHELILLSLFSLLSSATPYPQQRHHAKRALTFRTFDEMSIANGTAGNAAAEALTTWTQGVDLTNLAGVSADDLNILKTERENAETAETSAFDPAIDAAGGADVATALQCGKIKNKVLKLTGLSLVDNITIAQGGDGVADAQSNLADTMTKLASNIALDQASAGQSCQGVEFTGSTP